MIGSYSWSRAEARGAACGTAARDGQVSGDRPAVHPVTGGESADGELALPAGRLMGIPGGRLRVERHLSHQMASLLQHHTLPRSYPSQRDECPAAPRMGNSRRVIPQKIGEREGEGIALITDNLGGVTTPDGMRRLGAYSAPRGAGPGIGSHSVASAGQRQCASSRRSGASPVCNNDLRKALRKVVPFLQRGV